MNLGERKRAALTNFFKFKETIEETKPEYIKVIDFTKDKKGLRFVVLVDWDKVNE